MEEPTLLPLGGATSHPVQPNFDYSRISFKPSSRSELLGENQDPSSSNAALSRSCRFGVSVVIPVLNESKRIASVVRFALRSEVVREVLVIDDGSIDGTSELAAAAGARVITAFMLGKGGSMEDGLAYAKCNAILYLDGDLHGLRADLIDELCQPILQNRADFVKARFSRCAGRVRVLTARPLLRTYFPEVAHFQQPLGGIVAARADILRRLRFENDYAVDIGLLLDAIGLGARVTEVDIGRIDHESHDLERLGEMATQVARAILDRAAVYGRLRRSFVRQARERESLITAQPDFIVSRIGAVDRLALFDMDGTLFDGRFVVELARRTGRESKLQKYLDRFDMTSRVGRAADHVISDRLDELLEYLPAEIEVGI